MLEGTYQRLSTGRGGFLCALLKPRRRIDRCGHPKPLFSNGKERKVCLDCSPRPDTKPRRPYTPREVVVRKCAIADCAAEFIPLVPHRIYCSATCRTRVGNASDRHKTQAKTLDRGSHRRRARKYGTAYENFSIASMLERDGWKCVACGISTPKALRGKWVHNAPELDHVVPLALGGSHSVANTQCLCRSCNGLKKDRTMDEFMRWLAA